MPIIKIHNIETDEIIEREMNGDELAQWETDKSKAQTEAAAKAAAAVAKTALLEKLGITEEEAKLLLG